MSYRWRRPTERGDEQDRPLMNGPVQATGPDGDHHAGTRPHGSERPISTCRARIRAS